MGALLLGLFVLVAAYPPPARPALLGRTIADGASAFAPESVTFVSPSQGWVLGVGSCRGGGCLGLFKTTDGGSRWSQLPVPPGLASLRFASAFPGSAFNVRFADPLDGWLFGGILRGGYLHPQLWATHDGGRSWRPVRLALIDNDSSILDLEATASTAYLLVTTDRGSVTVARSPVATEQWTRAPQVLLLLPAGGAEPSGSLILEGAHGWLIEGNDRGTSGSARLTSNGSWTAWSPPCRNVGGTFAVPAAAGVDMAAVCVMGGFASPLSPAAPRGARLGSSWLYVSDDDGRSFTAAAELGGLGTFFGPVAEPVPGTILVGRSSVSSGELEASFDGGHRWTTVAHGSVVYLGFTTATQGVAITQSSSGAHGALLMSYDGGHRWRTIVFPALRS